MRGGSPPAPAALASGPFATATLSAMHPTRFVRRLACIAATLPLLASCGGGGGDSQPTVTSASVANAVYGRTALITVNGSGLDGSITVASPGCTGMTRSTSAPNASTDTTAYYTCTVSAIGSQNATIRRADSLVLGSAAYVVPAPQVTMTVDNGAGVAGSMVITLAPDKTPVTVDNFLAYVNSGFYDGTVFHRVFPNFVIQGGGFLPITALPPTARTPTLAPIALEVGKGLSNTLWTISMARTNAPDSATSQFFINVVDNAASLDPGPGTAGYAVFGSVTANTALAATIANAPCAPIAGFSECAPNPNVVITTAEQTR